VIEFLRRRHVSEDELKAFLTGNLRRFAIGRDSLRTHKAGADAVHAEGISIETSLLVNLAIEDALRALRSKGALPAHIRHIAVIGPGLEFVGEPGCSDVYPPQSPQPFAILEGVLKLGVVQPSEVQITAIDFNPYVLAHLRAVTAKARTGTRYTMQLPRRVSAGWKDTAIAYWQHFGETIGIAAPPVTAPSGFQLRAVAVKPQYAARINVEDLNVAAQTLETAAGQGFDLVVATNVLGYYGATEQALALTSIARMMASGGVFLTNNALPAQKPAELEPVGSSFTPYLNDGSGESIAMYRRR
jgi:hypothetical protein